MTAGTHGYHLFQYQDRVAAVRASNWDNPSQPAYVLRTDLEQQFAATFPAHSTLFECNGTSLQYESVQDPNVSTPERIVCVSGEIIQISTTVKSLVTSPSVLYPTAEYFKKHLILTYMYTKLTDILARRVQVYKNQFPRLFIVLPEESSSTTNNSVPQFRIHFLCECGQDSTTYSTHFDPSHLGYPIRRQEEFFTQFSPYLRLISEAIKLGMAVVDHHFEPVSDPNQNRLFERLDILLLYLEERRGPRPDPEDPLHPSAAFYDLRDYFSQIESVDLGAVVDYFHILPKSDILSGLFRVRSSQGYAKWVCKEHHRLLTNKSEQATSALIDFLANHHGSYEEQRGVIHVVIPDENTTFPCYRLIGKVNGVLEVDVTLNWDQRVGEIDNFTRMIRNCKIPVLNLNLMNRPDDPKEEGWDEKFTSLFEMMQFPWVQAVSVCGIPDLWTRFLLRDEDTKFDNLKEIRTPAPDEEGRARVATFLARAQNLEVLKWSMDMFDWGSAQFAINTVVQSRREGYPSLKFELRDDMSAQPVLWLTVPAYTERRPPSGDLGEVDFLLQYARYCSRLAWGRGKDILSVSFEAVLKGSKLTTYVPEYESGAPLQVKDLEFHRRIIGVSPFLARLRVGPIYNLIGDIFFSNGLQWKNLTTLELEILERNPSSIMQAMVDSIGANNAGTPQTPLRQLAMLFRDSITDAAIPTMTHVLSMLPLEGLAISRMSYDSYVPDQSSDELWLELVGSINYSKLEWLNLSRYEPYGDRLGKPLVDRILENNPSRLLRLGLFGFSDPTDQQGPTILKEKGIEFKFQSYDDAIQHFFEGDI